jgi:hypothetical protein
LADDYAILVKLYLNRKNVSWDNLEKLLPALYDGIVPTPGNDILQKDNDKQNIILRCNADGVAKFAHDPEMLSMDALDTGLRIYLEVALPKGKKHEENQVDPL